MDEIGFGGRKEEQPRNVELRNQQKRNLIKERYSVPARAIYKRCGQ